jgi:iron complex outermembrane receptor protein
MRIQTAPVHQPKAIALAAFLLLAGQSAQAQAQAQAQADQTIVVKGQRASLEKAQDIKRNADQIVDSIVADDIGKLPDANVAEALQRITGVQISRNRGEGDRVQVRGLQQTQTLLNGRVIFTAGKERGLSFQDVPAELLAGVDVYKAPTADLVEGGIGGVIDMRTRRPFDFAGSKIAGTIKGTHADLVGKSNVEGSVLVSNRWKLDAGEFGALLSVSTQKRSYRFDTQDIGGPAALADGSGILAPTGQWVAYQFGERDRSALSAALQWRPSASAEYTLDWNQTRLKTQSDIHGHYASPFWANFNAATGQGQLWPNGPVTTDADGRFISGRFWGASMSTSSAVADDDTRTSQVSLAGKWKLSDATRVKAELNHTSSKYDRFYNEVRLGTWADPATYVYDIRTDLPSAYSPEAQLTNPAQYWADKTVYFRIKNKGSDTAARADVDHSMADGTVSRVRGGVRLSDRQAESAEVNALDGFWPLTLADVPYVGLIPQSDLLRKAGDGNVPRQWLGVTNAAWLRDPNAVFAQFGRTVPAFDPAQTFDYQERSAAAYGIVDLDTTLAGRPLTGNVGLRLVKTSIDRSYIDVAGARQSASSSDTDVLPSINLRWEIQRDLVSRVALSRVITRPSFDQLTPSLSLNVNDRTGFRGNPGLDKLSANQFDATLEYYLSPSDHVYAALFFKQVKGFIQTSSSQVDVRGTTYTLSTPSNGDDGRIRGLELGYQAFFKALPGVGVQANATFINSSAPSPLTGGTAPLEGLSERSANVVLIYDRPSGFSARLAYNWRSDYNGGARLTYPSNDGRTAYTPVTAKAYGVVDAYLSYAFKPGLKLALEANNLTRTVRQTTYGDYRLPASTYVDDRRYAISLNMDL